MIPMVVPAALALAVACIHLFLGGREIARPLLASRDMAEPVRLTHYHCWHLVTITLFALAAAFGWAAWDAAAWELALFATAISALFCIWGLALVVSRRQRHMHMPQWILFAVLTVVGALALI